MRFIELTINLKYFIIANFKKYFLFILKNQQNLQLLIHIFICL